MLSVDPDAYLDMRGHADKPGPSHVALTGYEKEGLVEFREGRIHLSPNGPATSQA